MDPPDLEDLDEDDLSKTFTNVHCTPPTVTASVSVPIQVVTVFKNSQKILIITSRVERHYESFGWELNPSMMNWKFIKDLDLQITALKDNKKHNDPRHKWDHYFVNQL